MAAPVTEDPALFPVLAKRSTECNAEFGYSILMTDCHEVLRNMRNLPQFRPDRGNGIFESPTSEFSRTAPDGRLRLPQALTVRSCTILVDVTHGMSSVTISRYAVADAALRIMRQCVRGLQRTGGIDTEAGIDTVIANEGNLDHRLRVRWGQCMALVQNNTPFDEHAQCLLYDLEVEAEAQARERAGMSGDHAVSKG